MPFYIRPRTMR